MKVSVWDEGRGARPKAVPTQAAGAADVRARAPPSLPRAKLRRRVRRRALGFLAPQFAQLARELARYHSHSRYIPRDLDAGLITFWRSRFGAWSPSDAASRDSRWEKAYQGKQAYRWCLFFGL